MGVRQIPILENQARIACKNFLWLVCRRSFGRIDGWVVGGWIYSRSVFLYVQAISAWISGIGSARFVGGVNPPSGASQPPKFSLTPTDLVKNTLLTPLWFYHKSSTGYRGSTYTHPAAWLRWGCLILPESHLSRLWGVFRLWGYTPPRLDEHSLDRSGNTL